MLIMKHWNFFIQKADYRQKKADYGTTREMLPSGGLSSRLGLQNHRNSSKLQLTTLRSSIVVTSKRELHSCITHDLTHGQLASE